MKFPSTPSNIIISISTNALSNYVNIYFGVIVNVIIGIGNLLRFNYDFHKIFGFLHFLANDTVYFFNLLESKQQG